MAIKVDREERPDIDAVYMAFVQAFTGSGGWPMNVWLTPAREPFFGGTYFPPRAAVRGARTGLLDVLAEQARRFAADPSGIASQAHAVVSRLTAMTAPEPAGDFPDASILRDARAAAAQRFDPENGGTIGAPKFPSSFPVQLLLRIARRACDADAQHMATVTLEHMRSGGIYDQLGGGFHRYATDERWLVPHFEKMLYDNALLAVTYLEAAQATGDPRFAVTARETLDYLLRGMRAPDGTFYAATDADSQTSDGRREEGAYFTWTPDDLRSALGDADAEVAQHWFGVTSRGQVDGRSVLSASRPPEEVARQLGVAPDAFGERLATIRKRLFDARSGRAAPLRDEKVVVSWNGLAISALARAAIVLGDARYSDAAVRAAGVIFNSGHELPHVLVAGVPKGRAFADDRALFASALLDVFELTSDATWLTSATLTMEQLEHEFSDPVHGGYYLTSPEQESLLLRNRPDEDGPVPSVKLRRRHDLAPAIRVDGRPTIQGAR